MHSSGSRGSKRARERESNSEDRRLWAGTGHSQSVLLSEDDGRPPPSQVDGTRGIVRPSIHLSVRRLVVRRPPMGDYDAGRHAVPIGTAGRETVQDAAERPPDGETSVLFPGDLSLDARLLELPASGATHLHRASPEPGQDSSSHSE